MKLKKLTTLLLASAMVMGSFAGCGGSDGSKKSDEADASSQEEQSESEDDKETEAEAETESEGKPFEGVTLTFLNRSDATPRGTMDQLIAVAEEKFGFEIEMEITDDDNVVLTRLATGDCPDLLLYNTGSLLFSANPSEYFLNLTDTEAAKTFDDAFIQAASVDGVLYGVPNCDSMAGGVFYNKEMYEEYGLEVPKTWDEFMTNLETLKNAGESALGAALKDVVSSQLPFLGDNYQLLQEEPDFAEKFTAGEIKFADSEAGLRVWEKYEDLVPYFNTDCSSVTADELVDRFLGGEFGHYITLTNSIANWQINYGEEIDKLGFFAIPGDTVETTGLTVWPANAIYGSKNSENTDAILAFLEWFASDEGMDALTSFYTPGGGFHTGYQWKGEIPDVLADVQKYYVEGNTAPALEYLTPIKGANCPQICSELASGQTTAKEAAEAYDKDCEKAAMQLGLWN